MAVAGRIHVAVYVTATGVITQLMTADEDGVAAALKPGQWALEVGPEVGDTTHYVKNNAALPYPVKPTPSAVWDLATEAWVDQRTLQQLKDEKWEQVKAARIVAYQKSFTVGGFTFNGDLPTRLYLTQLGVSAVATSSGWAGKVATSDEVVGAVNKTQMLAIIEAMRLQNEAVYVTANLLRGQINAATTKAQLDAIVISL